MTTRVIAYVEELVAEPILSEDCNETWTLVETASCACLAYGRRFLEVVNDWGGDKYITVVFGEDRETVEKLVEKYRQWFPHLDYVSYAEYRLLPMGIVASGWGFVFPEDTAVLFSKAAISWRATAIIRYKVSKKLRCVWKGVDDVLVAAWRADKHPGRGMTLPRTLLNLLYKIVTTLNAKIRAKVVTRVHLDEMSCIYVSRAAWPKDYNCFGNYKPTEQCEKCVMAWACKLETKLRQRSRVLLVK